MAGRQPQPHVKLTDTLPAGTTALIVTRSWVDLHLANLHHREPRRECHRDLYLRGDGEHHSDSRFNISRRQPRLFSYNRREPRNNSASASVVVAASAPTISVTKYRQSGSSAGWQRHHLHASCNQRRAERRGHCIVHRNHAAEYDISSRSALPLAMVVPTPTVGTAGTITCTNPSFAVGTASFSVVVPSSNRGNRAWNGDQ